MRWYTPTTELTETERSRGLHFLYLDGLCGHAMTLLVTGAFLPGMAVALGASNFIVGLLASLGPISQMLQIPAIIVVERVRLRKLLTVAFAIGSRLMLFVVAIPPFFFTGPGRGGEGLFLVSMALFFALAAASGCSFNSWIKDLIPGEILGSYLARRLSAATVLGAALTVAAGFGIDWLAEVLEDPSRAYAVIFATAGMIGFVGVVMLGRVPEPVMGQREPGTGWIQSLGKPLHDENFRRLLAFTAVWNFTITMAGAFFTVYMLRRLGLSMGNVILLAVLGQVTNIYFFRVWGAIADRFSNQSVLKVVVPLYILVILLWPFTTMPERYFLTVPLLIVIHVLSGISTAGFLLCAGNIALKLAPPGQATAYLGANAFSAGIAATLSPVLGGAIASFFGNREFSVALSYRRGLPDGETFVLPAVNFQGIDFVFFGAALFGIWSLFRLSRVEEEGSVSEAAVREEVYTTLRRTFASTSNMSGARRMAFFPYEMLRQASSRRRSGRRGDSPRRVKPDAEKGANRPETSPAPEESRGDEPE